MANTTVERLIRLERAVFGAEEPPRFSRDGDTITKTYEVTITRQGDREPGDQARPNLNKHLEMLYRAAGKGFWYRITDIKEVS